MEDGDDSSGEGARRPTAEWIIEFPTRRMAPAVEFRGNRRRGAYSRHSRIIGGLKMNFSGIL